MAPFPEFKGNTRSRCRTGSEFAAHNGPVNNFGDDGWPPMSDADPAPLQASLLLATVALVGVVVTSFLPPM